MKEGDLVRTHTAIPVNPIRPVEGDSHPLGALPLGTTVCMVSRYKLGMYDHFFVG